MPKRSRNPENGRCGLCHEIRTIIQIRQILELKPEEDVIEAVRILKAEVERIRERSLSA